MKKIDRNTETLVYAQGKSNDIEINAALLQDTVLSCPINTSQRHKENVQR